VLVVRFCENFEAKQLLLRVEHYATSLNAVSLTKFLVQSLSVIYSIPSENVLATMHDSASVNEAAISGASFMWDLILDMPCFSHLISLVWGRITCPEAEQCLSAIKNIFSHSHNARYVLLLLFHSMMSNNSIQELLAGPF